MAVFSVKSKLKELFSGGKIDEDFFENLEDSLIESDFGARSAVEAIDQLRTALKKEKIKTREEISSFLKSVLKTDLKSGIPIPDKNHLNLYLILGVNGVGKTTTAAKLADYYHRTWKMVPVLSAGDTFRAAAIDQLKIHGERLNIRVVSQNQGADPGAVLFDTIASASARKENLIIADTAGRMHTKTNLVKELQKIDKIVAGKIDPIHYKKFLIIDATTGQNGYQQAELFHEAVGVDYLILAKYDSSSKGGTLYTISKNLGIPVAFLGTGERYADFAEFDSDSYLNAMID